MALIGAAILIIGFFFLKGRDVLNTSKMVYVVYERVDGLVVSSPVLIRGLNVGRVAQLRFLDNQRSRVLVRLDIKGKMDIPENTLAELISADILGSKAIRLVFPDSINANTIYIQSGDTLPGLVEKTLRQSVDETVQPVKIKAEELLSSLDSILITISYFLSDSTRERYNQGFDNLASTIENLNKSSKRIDLFVKAESERFSAMITHFLSISENLAKNNDLINNIIKNLSAISDSVERANIQTTIVNAEKAIREIDLITEKINSGEGSLGLLLEDDALYNNLESTARSLDLLLKDIKDNPRRYTPAIIKIGGGRRSKRDKPQEVQE